MIGSRKVLVAVIGAPHGIRGELRLKSLTETPAAVASYGPLFSEDGGSRFVLDSVRVLKGDLLVVRIDGVHDRTAAERLTNTRLFVDRDRFPRPEEDEFYHADLVGLRAETENGQAAGRIVAIQNFGAGDLLEIAPDAGESVLVPFAKAFVPVIDLAGRRVVVTDAAFDGADDPASDRQPSD